MGFQLPDLNIQEGLRAAGEFVQGVADAGVAGAGKIGTAIGDAAGQAFSAVAEGVDGVKKAVEGREPMNFQSIEALQPVVNVVNDAAAALNDQGRTIRESAIPEVVGGVLGATAGGAVSFAALYGLGTLGFSAAGMTSALAAAGTLVGGGMAAGVFVLAAPVAVAAGAGVAFASGLKAKQLQQEKERLYKEALKKHQAIIQALKDEADASKERLDYLQSLNVLLRRAVEELREDLDRA